MIYLINYRKQKHYGLFDFMFGKFWLIRLLRGINVDIVPDFVRYISIVNYVIIVVILLSILKSLQLV